MSYTEFLIELKRDTEAERMEYALSELKKIGVEVTQIGLSEIQFSFKDNIVKFFPYTGWHTGKSIIDGRGIGNLLKQLKK